MVSSFAPNKPNKESIEDSPARITKKPVNTARIIECVAISVTEFLSSEPIALDTNDEVPTPSPITMPLTINQTGNA